MKIPSLICTLLALGTGLFAVPPAAESGSSGRGRPLTVGIDRAAAPMEYETADGPDGFNIDIMRLLADTAGYDIEFRFLPWPVILASVRSGELDIMFALETPERLTNYLFSKPFLAITLRIFVRDETVGISTIADLEDRTVAVVRGFAEHDYLLKSILPIHIVEVESVPQALDLLAAGDVSAFFGQYHLTSYYLQQKKIEDIKMIGDVIDVLPFGIATSRGNPELIRRVNAALATIKSNGSYQRLYEKWYGSAMPGARFQPERILPWLFGLLGGIGLLTLWIRLLRRQVRAKTAEVSANLEKFRLFTERAPYPVAIVAGDTIEYINPKFIESFGYTLDEIPDCETWFRKAYPDPEYRARVSETFVADAADSARGSDTSRVFEVRTKSGDHPAIDFRMIRLEDGRLIMVMSDITAQQKLEEERLRQEKLESVSLLAGGIAHDFNNILMHLIGYVDLMQLDPALPAEHRENLAKMDRSIQRATGITNQLLTFSRGGAPVKKLQPIRPLVTESLDFVMHGSNCTARTDFADKLPDIEIDAGQISQTLNNLFINAIQAMPGGGTIEISVDTVRTREHGTRLRIRIADSGLGIDPDKAHRIFTPYFTSKEHGTGLGLTTAYSIIKKHGGTIDFASEPGRGTTFTILLPVAGKKAATEMAAGADTGACFSARVLIMDDEPSIRDILGRMLERLGCRTGTAASGEELVREYLRARDAGEPYDLVISDLTIPGGMGGKDAIETLRAADPAIRAIVSSGFSSDPVLANHAAYGFVDILVKPYSYRQLQEVLERVLERHREDPPGREQPANNGTTY